MRSGTIPADRTKAANALVRVAPRKTRKRWTKRVKAKKKAKKMTTRGKAIRNENRPDPSDSNPLRLHDPAGGTGCVWGLLHQDALDQVQQGQRVQWRFFNN